MSWFSNVLGSIDSALSSVEDSSMDHIDKVDEGLGFGLSLLDRVGRTAENWITGNEDGGKNGGNGHTIGRSGDSSGHSDSLEGFGQKGEATKNTEILKNSRDDHLEEKNRMIEDSIVCNGDSRGDGESLKGLGQKAEEKNEKNILENDEKIGGDDLDGWDDFGDDNIVEKNHSDNGSPTETDLITEKNVVSTNNDRKKIDSVVDSVVESVDSVVESVDSVVESVDSMVESVDSVVESVDVVVEKAKCVDAVADESVEKCIDLKKNIEEMLDSLHGVMRRPDLDKQFERDVENLFLDEEDEEEDEEERNGEQEKVLATLVDPITAEDVGFEDKVWRICLAWRAWVDGLHEPTRNHARISQRVFLSSIYDLIQLHESKVARRIVATYESLVNDLAYALLELFLSK